MRGFCPLASGSKGNSIFFGDETKILIDAGLSLRQLKQKLDHLNIPLESIDALLITHEHIDHIRGIGMIAAKYEIPIFANADTAKALCQMVDVPLKLKIFSTGETFHFGDLEIHPFSIQHDTLDPVAFTITTRDYKAGFCADLGFVTSLVKNHLQGCDFLYVEANHEPSMVHACHRPQTYKQRVLSRQGHLSNQECAQLILEVMHPGLKHIHLAHLSQECNHPDLALSIVREKIKDYPHQPSISIAFQDQISTPVLYK